MYVAGLDVGSYQTKLVIIKTGGAIALERSLPSGAVYAQTVARILQEGCAELGLDVTELAGIVAAGIGAKTLGLDVDVMTDITCQGIACKDLFPDCHTVIDIGGTSTKVIRLDDDGNTEQFVVSEKCATGSGRFMQVVARILQMELDAIGPLSLQGTEPISFSTGCAVFAESDVITKIGEGVSAPNILAGMNVAIGSKICNMAKRVQLKPTCVMTGGASQNAGLVKVVGENLEQQIFVPTKPQFTCAYGAAILAGKRAQARREVG